ncbi:hypothetical protein MHU86_1021 [Fragilaria crotonensis]|nr:hypothetical protein MHU86_1021 [Fragilaria crotonensis]
MRVLILLLVVIGVAEIFLGLQLSVTTLPQSHMPNAPTQGGPGRVRFRPFAADPKYHNTTVNGKTIPGPFLNERLFLMGARLTTSYVPNDESVHVDVFGFPGDWLVESDRIICELYSLPKKWKFFKNEHFFENKTALYCQLECDYHDHNRTTTGATTSEPSWSRDCGEPIPMQLVPLVSGDRNQDGATFIWRCDVSHLLSKAQLIQQQHGQAARSSVRVRLDLKLARKATKTTVSLLQLMFGAKPPPTTYYTMYEVTKIDIPLHTGVVGHGGPQIRSSQQGYFSPLIQQNDELQCPMDVGLCIAIYGKTSTRYLAEFVQHHKNVGISHIVVGMDTTMDSVDLYAAEEVLRPFIDEGFVVLQSTGLKDFFKCESDMAKLHFYHQCLYYFKGLSKYSATWDLDEYWIPPVQLEITGKNSFKYGMVAFADEEIPRVEKSVTRGKNRSVELQFIQRSSHTAFSDLVTSDPLWRKSNYSKSISIRDVLKAVEQAHKYRGCEDKWCYYLTPSFYSFMKTIVTRTHRIGHDFDRRDAKSDRTWQKAIARTQVAMMGGIHLPGSCRFPNDPEWYPFSKKEECFPRIWDSGEYGRILHYQSLMQFRDDWNDVHVDEWAEDEYVSSYAGTVSAQLNRHNYGIAHAEP